MKKAFLTAVAAIALVIGFSPAAFAVEAHAEAHAESVDAVQAAADVKSAVIVNTDAEGKIVGSWFQNPSKHWDPAKALKVPFAASWKAGVSKCSPFRLEKGQWYPRTLKMRDGTPFQVKGGNHVKHAWALFDVAGNCQIRHRGFYNPRTHKWVGDCVNPKPRPEWPTIPASQVVEVKQHTSIDYQLSIDWLAWGQVHGSVAVDCGSSSASASFNTRGEVGGNLLLTVSASTEAEARSKGAEQVRLSLESSTEVETDIMVSGEVAAEGEAEADCHSDDTPPESTPPTIVQFREVNDVYVNATTEHCVTVDTPDGHSATVHWTAKFGSFATSTKSAQDMVQVCATYKAPSEVPSGGTDTITVKATDDVTDLSVTQATDPFVIKPMPTTP